MSGGNVKILLANRLWAHSQQVDRVRNSAEAAFQPDDFLWVARRLDEALICLGEVERIWEALYGYKPTSHDMLRWKTL